MYKIIGADNREYGPVTGDQIRDWVRQGRANRHTRARLEENADWRSLDHWEEFASLFEGPTAAPGYGLGFSPGSTAEARAIAEAIIASGVTTHIGACVSRGWALMCSRFWLTAGASAVVLLLIWAAALIPVVGSLLLDFVIIGGLYWMLLKLVRNQPTEFADAFSGFGKRFFPLMLFSIVAHLLFMLGLILLILPALYVMVVYMLFPSLLIMDKGLEFWPAMEVSRRVAQRHFWPLLGLVLLACLGFIIGLALCLVGAPISIAWFSAAMVYAYEDLFGSSPALPSAQSSPL